MQAQVNIAETELNRRRGGETSGEENVDSNNEKNFEQQESDYQENMSNVDENGLPRGTLPPWAKHIIKA
jgi:hypothetical protein